MSLPTNLKDLQGYHDCLARDIEQQVKRRAKLLADAENCKRQAAECERQANELLRPGFRGESGTIPEAREKLAKAARMIEDFDKPLVYWSKYSGNEYAESTATPSGWSRDLPTYIVEKVTKKRIYVRKKGEDQSLQFEHDGTNVGRYQRDRIDIAKTFPQGVKPS